MKKDELKSELDSQNTIDGKMKGETFWAYMNELFYEKHPEERPK